MPFYVHKGTYLGPLGSEYKALWIDWWYCGGDKQEMDNCVFPRLIALWFFITEKLVHFTTFCYWFFHSRKICCNGKQPASIQAKDTEKVKTVGEGFWTFLLIAVILFLCSFCYCWLKSTNAWYTFFFFFCLAEGTIHETFLAKATFYPEFPVP